MLACQLKVQEALFQHDVLCSLSLLQKGKLIWNDQLGLYAAGHELTVLELLVNLILPLHIRL